MSGVSGDIGVILDSTSRLAAPLLFVGLGELVAERAGTLNISVEAMMLGGAYGAALASSASGSVVVGLLAGVLVGLVVALVQANLSHRLSLDQFVVGLTLNVLLLGLTSFLLSSVDMTSLQFGKFAVPLLSDLPWVGRALFDQRLPFYALYVLIPLVWWLLQRTRWGLEVRAVGEDPHAADSSGVPVLRRRRQAVVFCGLLSGLGGAYLSVGVIGTFTQNMTAGRGFIAIAAVIFGAWTVRWTVVGCLLFGAADALRLALPALGVVLNSQLLIASPYLLALLAMLLLSRGKRQPLALALPFRREAT
jgi:simple sugar transport system permease protein